MRRAVVAAVVLLALAACRDGNDETATPPADRPATTTAAGGSASASTTVPPSGRPAAVHLRPGGIGTVSFGAGDAEMRAVLTAAFGPPRFEETLPPEACSTGATRRLSWGDLMVLLGPDAGGRLTMVGWTYGTATPPATPALTTAEGIGVGSTVAQLRSAYGGLEIHEDREAGVIRFSVPAGSDQQPLAGVLSGPGETGTVRALYAGSYCAE